MLSKSSLAVILSKIKTFDNPNPRLEQYPTDSEIVADVLWNAYMNKDIENKIIIDAGCGTGIIGIGCLLLGAKKVYFVDADKKVLKITKENIKNNFKDNNFKIIHQIIDKINIKADLVIQNPPFGSKNKHADKIFLEKAFSTPIIYSFHIAETKPFIEKISEDNHFEITHYWKYSFPLKKSMAYHTKKRINIDVGVWRLQKQSNS